MLTYLNEVLNKFIDKRWIVGKGLNQWNSVYVDYERPFVERLWIQDGENRIYIHRIHPCEQPFYHPHPWPSAMFVLSGSYEMKLGSDSVVHIRTLMGEDHHYEMTNLSSWHSVRPIDKPVISIMVTGKPWKVCPYKEFKSIPQQQQRSLTEVERKNLIRDFRYAAFRAKLTKDQILRTM